MSRRSLLLVLGLGLVAAGIFVEVIPVPTTVGYGCGGMGCIDYRTFTVPSIVLGAFLLAVGLILLAYRFGMDEESD